MLDFKSNLKIREATYGQCWIAGSVLWNLKVASGHGNQAKTLLIAVSPHANNMCLSRTQTRGANRCNWKTYSTNRLLNTLLKRFLFNFFPQDSSSRQYDPPFPCVLELLWHYPSPVDAQIFSPRILISLHERNLPVPMMVLFFFERKLHLHQVNLFSVSSNFCTPWWMILEGCLSDFSRTIWDSSSMCKSLSALFDFEERASWLLSIFEDWWPTLPFSRNISKAYFLISSHVWRRSVFLKCFCSVSQFLSSWLSSSCSIISCKSRSISVKDS